MKLEKLDIDYYVEKRLCKLLGTEEWISAEIHHRICEYFNLKGEGDLSEKNNNGWDDVTDTSFRSTSSGFCRGI